jgi:hypothetical protein
MDSICSEIKEDMHKIEEDSKKIDCYAILDLIKDTFKCILDSLKCCFFRIKYNKLFLILLKYLKNLKKIKV